MRHAKPTARGIPVLGTPAQAIDFAIGLGLEAAYFLRDWREGNIAQWGDYAAFLVRADNKETSP